MSKKPLLEIEREAHAAQLITVYWFGRLDQIRASGGEEPLITQAEFRVAAHGHGWSEFGAIYERLVEEKAVAA